MRLLPRTVLIALTASTLVKLLLAWFTFGTNDVTTWMAFAHNAQTCGICVLYIPGPFTDAFNHPPFMIHVLKLLALTGTLFPFALRLLAITADIGMVLLTPRLLPTVSTPLLLSLALNPVSILVSGFHGNTDPVMVFFLVLCLYLIKVKRVKWAAVAFAMACNVKILPLLLLPATLLSLSVWRQRIWFAAIALITILLGSLPYIAVDPLTIAKNTLGYRGFYGTWGLSRILVTFNASLGVHGFLDFAFRPAIILSVLALSVWMNRKKIDLPTQLGAILFLLFTFTQTMGVQYFVWPIPLVLVLGWQWAWAYFCSAGSYIFLSYHFWSGGGWYYALAGNPLWSKPSYVAGAACWGVCAFILLRYRRELTRRSKLEADPLRDPASFYRIP